MKRLLLILILGAWFFAPLWAQPKSGHYDGIDNKSEEALFNAVSAAANQGYKKISYDGLYNAYEKTDMKNGKIWDMYSDCSFPTGDKCGNYKNECDCYNREHSVPQSWWGGGTGNQGSDIFHVIPTDGKVNGMRSNLPFGEVGSASYTSGNGCKVGTSSFSGYTGKVFEPIDEYKGDLARGILGAMTKWKGNWTESNGNVVFTGTYTKSSNFGLKPYAMNLFLKWHRQDPVSQKELDRNNGIEDTQGNRNPFIDYPELVEYIWGNKKGQTVKLSSLCSAYTGDCTGGEDGATLYYPDPYSTLTLDECTVGETLPHTISVVGDKITGNITFSFSGTHATYFTVSPTYITAEQANEGHPVAIIYKPTKAGTHSASLVVTSSVGDFESFEMAITATAVAGSGGEDPGNDDPVVIPDGDYHKVTSTLTDYSGLYLIVNEGKSVVLDGSKSDALASANTMSVTIANQKITATTAIDAAAFTVAPMTGGYSIQAQDGTYIGGTSKNTILTAKEPILNTISIANSNAVIGSASRTLRYNESATMFRYYSTGQKDVQLYKKHTISSAVEQVGMAHQVVAYGNRLVCMADVPTHLQVFDYTGRLILQANKITTYEATLNTGIYLVRFGNTTTKISIYE